MSSEEFLIFNLKNPYKSFKSLIFLPYLCNIVFLKHDSYYESSIKNDVYVCPFARRSEHGMGSR